MSQVALSTDKNKNKTKGFLFMLLNLTLWKFKSIRKYLFSKKSGKSFIINSLCVCVLAINVNIRQ